MPNMVRELRRKLNMSQRDLAEKAHTSQPTIQRIEADVSPVGLLMAREIAEALGKPIAAVFPEMGRKPRGKKTEEDSDDDETWTLWFHLRGGVNRPYVVTGAEHQRVMGIVNGSGHKAFACFQSAGLDVAVRVSEVLYVEIDEFVSAAADLNDTPEHSLRVWFLGETEPHDWFVEGDREEGPEADEAPCQDFMMALDSAQEDDWSWDCHPSLPGEDDHIYIRIQACALIEMDLSCTNPRLAEAQLAGEIDEDDLKTMPPAGKA